MIHKNLTPFHWGPRVTSRRPPQPELAVCVRGVFRIAPGKPLEAITDPMEQGFMSGDTFADDDVDQHGPLVHANDFADWKLHAEMLLKGTCHPPGGTATSCDVRFAVGAWSKTLRVHGPRVYEPGLLLGGKVSAPQPFTKAPLSWQNAYGGDGYAANPAGKGFTGAELPAIELPDAPVTKTGKRDIVPASFLPQSPHWPQRAGKRGKNYGPKWKKTRAPFCADDFDWTHFQSAPPDQWLDGYLRGDEEVVFENLHPQAPVLRTRLPALRLRAFVKTDDGVVREPEMNLDTLFADLDAGRLYLTWRGHAPIREIDMTDVGVVVIASEPLAEPAKPFDHYAALLAQFEADPIGVKAAMPPGFMAVASAVEAAELAERNGEPMPDLKAVAASLPADCPFPPWFLAAAAGEADPLGVEAALPPSLLDKDDPLGLKAQFGGLADPAQVDAAMAELPKLKDDPGLAAEVLKSIVGLLPADKQALFQGNVDALAKDIATSKQHAGSDVFTKAADAQKAAPTTAEPMAASYAKAIQQANDGVAMGAENALAAEQAAVAEASAKMAQAPSTLDDAVAQALAPLDSMELPPMPDIPDVDAQLGAQKAELAAAEAKARAQHGDHPMFALFGLGNRILDNAPRPGDVAPDLSPVAAGLAGVQAALLAQGVSAKALGPLARLAARVEALVAKVPKRSPPPAGEFAQRDLRDRDFSRRDLRGAVFARCDLTNAKFAGSDVAGADFTDATLCGADFTGANLDGARLEQARLVKAKLRDARLTGADLRFADLSKCDLRGADLTGADLSLATLELVRGDGVKLARTKLDMARLAKSRLRGADLRDATSDMGSFAGSDLGGANLRGCRFHKVDFMKAVLDGADCTGASLRNAILRDTQANGASFRDAVLTGASATGAAAFPKSVFTGAQATRSVWMDVDLGGADLRHATFENASFQGVRGDDVDFAAARLKGACFRRANLVRPRFAQADLCGADFNEAKLDDANFRGANCYDAKFLGTRAVRSDFADAFTVATQIDDPENTR